MVGPGAGLRNKSATADSRLTSKYYWRPLGGPLMRIWLIGLAVIPLLMAVIGYSLLGESESGGVTVAPPTTSKKSGGPQMSLAPLSIFRSDKNITVNGDFPDDTAKTALVNAIKDGLGQDVNIVDEIHINPAVKALDFAKSGPLFKAAAPIADFSLVVDGDTITLTGSPGTDDQRDAVEHAAAGVWPNVNVVDKMEVKPQSSTAAAPAPSPAPPAPGGPAPTPAPPAVPPGDPCANLQAAINAMTGGPISFGSDGVSLPPPVQQTLTQVAARLKACPTAHVTVNGYTDNSGSEGINIPLSEQRAGTVADFLVAQGVTRDRVTPKGLGSMNPIATNDTPDGRAKNRRAEIVVN